MMTRMFKPQPGKDIEVYINDMVVKSKVESKHINDFGTVFEILRRHKMCLNATKCSFGVRFGKFLGYMVTTAELKSTQIRLEQSTTCNLPEIPKGSKS